MPTYSYRCTECGEAFDIQQAFTDDTLTVCPNCGGKLRKLFSAVGVSFTGSGFYRNDSRAPAPKEGASDTGSASSDSSSSSPAKAESSKSESSKSESPKSSKSGASSTPSPSSPTPAAPATPSKKE